MLSPQPATLEEKIASLAPEVDAAFREELPLVLATLRATHNPKGVLLQMSPLALQVMREVFNRAKRTPPSDNSLWSCILRAGSGDEKKKINGLRLLPRAIETHLHPLRILHNDVDHRNEEVAFTAEHAEHALNGFLLVLQWFYCQYEHGPHLSSIYGGATGATAEAYARYYQDCVARWLKARYPLDTHFVYLTLLRSRGEEAQGPLVHSAPEQFDRTGLQPTASLTA